MTTQVDYLTEDQPIANQKYVVMSILSPGFQKNPEYSTLHAIKIRGSYDTYEEAQKRAAVLQKIDQVHNVFIGEVGKWLPFEDDPEKAKDMKYANEKLNNLMESYLKNQAEAKELYESRKNELMMQSLTETNKKKNKNKNKKSKKSSNDLITTKSSDIESANVDIDLSELKSTNENNIVNGSDSENENTNHNILKLEEELERAKMMLNDSIEDREKINELREYCDEMDNYIANKNKSE